MILDEAGILLDKKKWYKQVVKSIHKVFQTFRAENLMVFLTMPSLGFIEKNIRKLFDGHFSMKKQRVLKFKRWQYNAEMDKVYKKYLRRDGRKIDKIKIGDVTENHEDLIREYERRRFEFLKELQMDEWKKLREIETQGEESFNLTIVLQC
ncbi:hypothetical protein C9439_03880 [archaeon SCG-AAA382B04]|nr:hypothetical protein C9439_03880 [archaeon SCG-AAA382B04]